MPLHNADVAAIFDEIADLLEISNENPFRVRAYRNAARTLRDLGSDITNLVEQGTDLTRLPGIGKDLAGQIAEIVHSGTSTQLGKLHKTVPNSLTELLRLPGIGPKRVLTLWQDLGIKTVQQLYRAAKQGRLRTLSGFGAKSEASILSYLAARQGPEGKRILLAEAVQTVEDLQKHLQGCPGVKDVVVAGSYRRGKETIGDIDILVTAAKNSSVMAHFTAYEDVAQVSSQGDTRATIILRSGLQVDLRLVPAASFGAALHYFTGSKAHNIAIRQLGHNRGLKINEYGVFKQQKKIAGKTEASVFAAVRLPYIPPELREDRGEIQAAQKNRLPKLAEFNDLRGDLHCHTRATDGHNSLEEMALAARQLGFQYLAITEHTQHLKVAHGFDADRLLEQMEEIDQLNATLKGITLLKGVEVDILEDGSLDLPNDVLRRLDLVIGAVHSHFKLSREKQTRRLLRAINHPHFSILAHPSGRLLGKREAYEVDMPQLIREAGRRGCFLELNAQPERLDLSDVYCMMARQEGVLVSINSDAHSVADFGNLHLALNQARRGWLEAKDILNSRPLKKLRVLLRQTM